MSKKQLKLTKWKSNEKPSMAGVYQLVYTHDPEIYYSHWDGKRFTSGWTTPERAFNGRGIIDQYPIKHWRGLAVKP